MSIDSDATGHKDQQLADAELQLILIAARNLVETLYRCKVDGQWIEITPSLERAIQTLRSYTKD